MGTWTGPGLYDRYSDTERAAIIEILHQAAVAAGRTMDEEDDLRVWDWITDLTSNYLVIVEGYKSAPPARRNDLSKLKKLFNAYDKADAFELPNLISALPQQLFRSIVIAPFVTPRQLQEAHLLRVGDYVRRRDERVAERVPYEEQKTMADLMIRPDVRSAFRSALAATIVRYEQRLRNKQRRGTRRNEPLQWLADKLADILEIISGKVGYSTIHPVNAARRRGGGYFQSFVKAVVHPLHSTSDCPTDAAITTVVRSTVRRRKKELSKNKLAAFEIR